MFRQAAEQGHPAAQSALGHLLLNGIGTQVDEREAFEWFSKAAAQGNTYAQTNLGYLY